MLLSCKACALALIIIACMCTVEPLYKGHAGTMKIVLSTEVKLYTKVLAADQNKCPL